MAGVSPRGRHSSSTQPNWSEPSISGEAADPDQDGHSNLQEFNAGTNPRDARSVLRAESVEWNGAPGVPLTLRFEAMPGKSYTVE